jgi:hypothetical protein
MLVLSTNDALSNAFQLLVSIVRDFYSAGRPCVGAALKPEIARRSNFTFSEQLLKFPRFGDFLRAAEAAGHVQLSLTPGGDIGVWPIGIKIPTRAPQTVSEGAAFSAAPSSSAITAPRSTQLIRVRQDLWNAFTSFSGGWFYDPAADIAHRDLGGDPQSEDHSGLISIPSARERTIEWMRSFAGMQASEIKTQLLSVLTGDTAPYHFNSLVRSNLALFRAWRRFHIQQVLAAVEAWAGSNGVQPKNVTDPMYWSVRPGVQPVERVAVTSGYPPQPLIAATPYPPQPPAAAPQLQPLTSMSRLSGSPLTGRLETLIDSLIEELVRLRGYIQIVRPGE